MYVASSVLGAFFDRCESGRRCGRFRPLMRISVVIGQLRNCAFQITCSRGMIPLRIPLGFLFATVPINQLD